ncbi:myosin heavy chain, striated muscle [Wyeomyia smithii]|uniref:myosin heavy chain, striated muscle n=1 Tax=Wyeomyia smithii TaxID=174621 RepID=UPI00246822C7|nr:myosin heavy chain, striated muscle [Wyeomyia smithii]
MNNQNRSSSVENILDLMDNLIRDVPNMAADLTESSEAANTTPVHNFGSGENRRILKMRQQLAKQNNFIAELKRKIQALASLSPKSISDQEELAFLRSRLEKEKELLKNVLNSIKIEEQKMNKGQVWKPIPLCSDPSDDVCRNPWMLGNVSTQENRFSYDLNISSLSSKIQIDETKAHAGVSERMQKELMNRDRVIEILQNRVDALTSDVLKVRRDNEVILQKTPKQSHFCEADMMHRLRFYKDNTDALERNLNQMGAALSILRSELGANLTENFSKSITCSTFLAPNNCEQKNHLPRQDDQYNSLLKSYTQKSDECKKLTDRLAKACSCQDSSSEKTELELLRNRCSELLDVQEEFKILMKEQGEQLDEYRNKYLKAQQKVEEQILQMEQINIKNSKIEDQINIEVQRIKTKFQDKLRQLAPFPNLLESEKQKVKQLRQSNEKLLHELKKSAKEIKNLEHRLHNAHASQNAELERAHDLLKVEFKQVSELLDEAEKGKSNLEDSLNMALKEIDEIRVETANIIARANERSQKDKKTAQLKQHELEVELVQCRAAAAVTINNREDALREMQNQIAVLSASFDDAQMHIQSLRNQLTFLRNEQRGLIS